MSSKEQGNVELQNGTDTLLGGTGMKQTGPGLWCSSRMSLAIIGFLGFVNLYTLRVNMSVAVVCMVRQNSSILTNGTNNRQIQDGNAELFDWNKNTQGLILGSFFWGYTVTQIPGGWLSARFGGKRVFGWCMLGTAIATLLCPIAAKFSPFLLMALRVIAGLGEGVAWPAMHSLWARWAPPLERSKLVGFTYAGAQVGNIIVFPLSGLLCTYGFDGGWPSVFYVFGGLGVIWFIAWMFLAYDSPSIHPRITTTERKFISDSLKGQIDKNINKKSADSIPWLSILTSPPFWAILIAHMTANWGTYTFLTNMPSYLREVFHYDVRAVASLSALPYIGFWVMIIITGFLADFLRTKGWLSTTHARKIFNSLGMLVPAAFVLGLTFVGSNLMLAVSFLICGISFIGCTYGSGFIVNHVDIAPKYAGLLFGITNTTASLPGFLAPYVIGVLTKNKTKREWDIVFYICVAIYVVGAVFYIIAGSGELQSWARHDKIELEDDELNVPIEGTSSEQTKL